MKIKFYFATLFLFIITFFVAVSVLPTQAYGKDRPDRMEMKMNGLSQRFQNRLDGDKLRSCEAREDAIKNRLTRLINLASNMQTKFDSIATRVETYYTSTVVPSGKIVPNYDELILDIETKKTAVQNALATAQTNADNFSCTSDDPKAALTQFRVDMQNVKSALKDYRTSIKNLIVAVHAVVEDSPSPSPVL